MMKLLALALLPVTLAQTVTCGNIAEGSRPKAFDCGDGYDYNPEAAEKVCPSRGCNPQVCCIEKTEEEETSSKGPKDPNDNSTNSNSTDVKDPEEVDVLDPEERICGQAIMGSRQSRHACQRGYTFDENRYYEPCGDICTDEICCKEDEIPDPWDCYSEEEFTPAKRSFCCITQRIGCAKQSCAWGAGVMSDDGSTCCNAACGECGGEGCYYRGGAGCCKTLIAVMNRPCSMYSAPCSMIPEIGVFRRSAPPPPMFIRPFPMEAPVAPFPLMPLFPHLMPAPKPELMGFPVFF